MPHFHHKIILIFAFFSSFACLSQNNIKNFQINISVPVIVDINKSSFNDGSIYDESQSNVAKYVTINASFKNVVIKNQKFFATYVSDEFFNYNQIIQISGEFSADQKVINSLIIESIYSIPADYSNFWWVKEDIEIYMKLENLTFNFGTYSTKEARIVAFQYSNRYYENRSHNRHDKSDEIFVKLNINQDTPLGGSIGINNYNVKEIKPISMSVVHDKNSLSKELADLMLDQLFYKHESGEVQFYERVEYFEQLLQEALLGTSELADPDYALKIEEVMEHYFKDMDLALYVYSQKNESNPELTDFTVEFVSKNGKKKLTLSTKETSNIQSMATYFSVKTLQMINSQFHNTY